MQADILKEDQAQNTCIFSTEFALRMMGDIQQWFVDHEVRNFYSVSHQRLPHRRGRREPHQPAGVHARERASPGRVLPVAGHGSTRSRPTCRSSSATGSTRVQRYRAGCSPDLGGRHARAVRCERRSQKLKYHIQTSGRSLHAREIQFNDIRTTLQALLAIYDNCNSLHTNAYDEAITTPTEASVRRAMAIQKIINQEFGLAKNENPWQGSYFLEQLTDQVEAAVLEEFDRLSDRGGVLGAMELQYQRTRIQEESLFYEHKKHDGSLPIVGINTFVDKNKGEEETAGAELRRATPEEKQAQIDSVQAFQVTHADKTAAALAELKRVAVSGGNTFDALMTTVRVASLGQISAALYEVGGEYRRNL